MLSASLSSLLETTINAWLNLDADKQKRLENLQGKVITLHLDEVDLPISFIFNQSTVSVSAYHDAQADLSIRTSFIHLIRLSLAQDSSRYLLEHSISIQGSVPLAQQFSQLLQAVDFDWESLLESLIGAAPTYWLIDTLQKHQQWLQESQQSLQRNVSEYLQEEIRLTIHPLQLKEFLTQTDTLYQDTERLAARIKRLTEHQ